jgi:hypothetical protein
MMTKNGCELTSSVGDKKRLKFETFLSFGYGVYRLMWRDPIYEDGLELVVVEEEEEKGTETQKMNNKDF